jgi:hypothetical protein
MVRAPLVYELASKRDYKLCVIGEMFQICNTLRHGVEWKETIKINSLHIFMWFVIGRNYIFFVIKLYLCITTHESHAWKGTWILHYDNHSKCYNVLFHHMAPFWIFNMHLTFIMFWFSKHEYQWWIWIMELTKTWRDKF